MAREAILRENRPHVAVEIYSFAGLGEALSSGNQKEAGYDVGFAHGYASVLLHLRRPAA